MGVNSLPKTATRQRRGCDLNPGPTVHESSTLTTRRKFKNNSLIFVIVTVIVIVDEQTKNTAGRRTILIERGRAPPTRLAVGR